MNRREILKAALLSPLFGLLGAKKRKENEPEFRVDSFWYSSAGETILFQGKIGDTFQALELVAARRYLADTVPSRCYGTWMSVDNFGDTIIVYGRTVEL
jgi:hypothetical protein